MMLGASFFVWTKDDESMSICLIILLSNELGKKKKEVRHRNRRKKMTENKRGQYSTTVKSQS